jgi:hypothetical protein
MGEILSKLMESPVASFVLLLLFWLAYKSLKTQINGVGRHGRAISSYILETESDEAKRKRLNEILKG